MAFRGHFEYQLDAKNRLNIPAKFRASFSGGLVLARWLDPCIAIFTPEGFDRFNESFIGDMHPLSPERRRLTRFFSGGSFDAELDSAGRVTLNAALLDLLRVAVDAHERAARPDPLRDQARVTARTEGAVDRRLAGARIADVDQLARQHGHVRARHVKKDGQVLLRSGQPGRGDRPGP